MRPKVLAVTGGGEDGFFLLETFLRCAKGAPWDGVVIAGPMAPESDLRTLQRLAAESNVAFHAFVPNLSDWLWSVDAMVCMGGYNTLAEGLATGLPMVCVPRTAPRLEQLMRARAFERLGLLQTIAPEELSLQRLRQAVNAAMHRSRQELLDRAGQILSFDGARQAANHILALAKQALRGGAIDRKEVPA